MEEFVHLGNFRAWNDDTSSRLRESIFNILRQKRTAGLLRQTLVDLAKALSLRFQGNFAKRCFICRVYIAISLVKNI